MGDALTLRSELSAERLKRLAAEAQEERASAQQRFLQRELDAARAEIARHHAAVASDSNRLRRELASKSEAYDTLDSVYQSLKERFNAQSVRLDEAVAQVSEARREKQRAELERQKDSEQFQREQIELVEALEHAKAELRGAEELVAQIQSEHEEAQREARDATTQSPEFWHAQYLDMRRQLDSAVAEIEQYAPDLKALTQEADDERARAAQLQDEKAELEQKADETRKELKGARQRVADLEREREFTEQHIRDLGRQVQHLVTNVELTRSGEQPLTLSELSHPPITTGDSSAQAVISQRMVVFGDVADLQRVNEDLLKSVRGLASRMENQEDVKAAAEALETLQNKYLAVSAELKALKESNAEMESKQAQLTSMTPSSVSEPTGNSTSAPDGVLESLLEVETQRRKSAEERLDVREDEYRELATRYSSAQNTIGRLEGRISAMESELQLTTDTVSQLRIQLSETESQREMWAEQERRLVAEANAQTQAAADLQRALQQQSQDTTRDLERRIAEQLSHIESLVSSQKTVHIPPEMTAELDDLRNEVEDRKRHESVIQSQLVDSQRAAQEHISDLETKLQLAESAKLDLQRAINAKGEELDKANVELNSVRSELTVATENLGKVKEELAKVSTRTGEADKLRLDLSRANDTLLTLQKELNQSRENAQAIQTAPKEADPAIVAANARVAELQKEVADLQESLKQQVAEAKAEADKRLAELQLSSDKASEDLKLQIDARIKEVESLRAELSATATQLTEAQAKLEQQQNQGIQGHTDNDPFAASSEPINSGEVEILEAKLKEKAGDDETVAGFRAAVVAADRARAKEQLPKYIQSRVEAQIREMKAEIEAHSREIVTKQMETKMQLYKKRADELVKKNEDLALVVRKLKGGVDVPVAMFGNGVMQAGPAPSPTPAAIPPGPSEPSVPTPASFFGPFGGNNQMKHTLNRPSVDRHGQGKRPGANRDQNQGQQKKRREEST